MYWSLRIELEVLSCFSEILGWNLVSAVSVPVLGFRPTGTTLVSFRANSYRRLLYRYTVFPVPVQPVPVHSFSRTGTDSPFATQIHTGDFCSGTPIF